MRISSELIENAPSFINPCKKREIDLRGNRIPAIENLAITQDYYDAIDLTNNDIRKLENFPLLKRLEDLYISSNRIVSIGSNIGEQLPNLESLVLTHNHLQHLSDLDPLASLSKLHTLSLLENAVCRQRHYRLYVIWKLPSLKLLDFRKIKQAERREAETLFGSEEGQKLLEEFKKMRTFVPGEESKKRPIKPSVETPEAKRVKDISAIKLAIANATSLAEVSKLQRQLESFGNV